MSIQIINTFSLFVLFAFAVRTVRNILYHLFLWQNKEYRLDRMLLHFRTKEGKNFLFGIFSSAKTILLLFFTIFVFLGFNLISSLIIWIYSLLIVVEGWRNTKELLFQKLPLPKFSIKIVFILISTIILQLIFPLTSSPRSSLDYLPFLDKLLGIMVAMQIGFFSIFARAKNLFVQSLAADKAKKIKNLRVIGVTGSYGKTSTKEFISHLLSGKYKVVKTQANNNTAIGAANTILKNMNKQTDLLIIEAGAYKTGEIKYICSLVEGKIKTAVLTGLNFQHLALFGSKKKIADAKYELIEALSPDGTALFNGNNPDVARLSRKAKKSGIKTLLYGFDKRFYAHAANIKVRREKIEFTLHIGKQKRKASVNLLGKHNLENVLAAAAVADCYGIGIDNIVKEIANLKPPAGTMVYRKIKDTALINDTYNANPDGVKAALDYLAIYNIPRILVLRPLIELGSEAENVHEELGELSANICDGIVLSNENYFDSFIKGVNKSFNNPTVVVADGREAFDYIEKNFKKKKVILFEGRDAERVWKIYAYA